MHSLEVCLKNKSWQILMNIPSVKKISSLLCFTDWKGPYRLHLGLDSLLFLGSLALWLHGSLAPNPTNTNLGIFSCITDRWLIRQQKVFVGKKRRNYWRDEIITHKVFEITLEDVIKWSQFFVIKIIAFVVTKIINNMF